MVTKTIEDGNSKVIYKEFSVLKTSKAPPFQFFAENIYFYIRAHTQTQTMHTFQFIGCGIWERSQITAICLKRFVSFILFQFNLFVCDLQLITQENWFGTTFFWLHSSVIRSVGGWLQCTQIEIEKESEKRNKKQNDIDGAKRVRQRTTQNPKKYWKWQKT